MDATPTEHRDVHVCVVFSLHVAGAKQYKNCLNNYCINSPHKVNNSNFFYRTAEAEVCKEKLQTHMDTRKARAVAGDDPIEQRVNIINCLAKHPLPGQGAQSWNGYEASPGRSPVLLRIWSR